jgi:DNA-binding NarL/FixJ family response regulator
MYHEGINAYLSQHASFKSIDCCDSLTEFSRQQKAAMPSADMSILLTDQNSHSDMSALKTLKEDHAKQKVVMVMYSANADFVHQCMSLGIEGLTTDQDSMQDLKTCIYAVDSGHICYPKHCLQVDALIEINKATKRDSAFTSNLTKANKSATQVNDGKLSSTSDTHATKVKVPKASQQPTYMEHLTSKQLTVVQLVEKGLSNKEIARELNLEVCTVKNHMHRILDKLHLRNRCEAASWYRKTPSYHRQMSC